MAGGRWHFYGFVIDPLDWMDPLALTDRSHSRGAYILVVQGAGASGTITNFNFELGDLKLLYS
jgi:hypothetical protein